MGRSGTSLTTALIGLLGVDLGPQERMLEPVAGDNARGYWELREIYEINEALLAAYGGTWESPPILPKGWERSPALNEIRERARALLTELFDGRRRWGWKDPRTAVTLPFWRELIGEMDYILCVRNPVDVAQSLAVRGTHELDFHASITLWEHYTHSALEYTRNEKRLIVNYEDYFLDPHRQIQRLIKFVTGASPSAGLIKRIEDFVDADLWHHRSGTEEMDRIKAASHKAINLYAHLTAQSPIPGRSSQS